MAIDVRIGQEFEECLDLHWTLRPPSTVNDFVVEMVLDRSEGADDGQPPRPAKNAMVKRVEMGSSLEGCIHNMPDGRKFLVSVTCNVNHKQVRSPWVRAITLSPTTRDTELQNLDPMSLPRTACKKCPCVGYVPFRWAMNTPEKMRCRRCSCHYTAHAVLELAEILAEREAKARKRLNRSTVVKLPSEGLHWNNTECMIWFCTDGAVHPRDLTGAHRRPAPRSASAPAESGVGKKGRVSVITPTTDSRHRFHEVLWACFDAQAWPDKELVVVETYASHYSEFLDNLAKQDSRLIYVRFNRPAGKDWSIGLKRNIGIQLATGEFVAHFDDDDLYAPAYLGTMIAQLEEKKAQIVKLSSWYIYDATNGDWGFCDPVAWGLTQGLDETASDVRQWAYGYGFSYVYRRQAVLEHFYDDMNLGEDFTFITRIQASRGERSVVLFHEDFGICLHVQHGANTSNSIPLREVSTEEASRLEITELVSMLGRRSVLGDAISTAVPPSKRVRHVLAHTSSGLDIEVLCAVSATVSDFLLACARVQQMDAGERYHVYRVRPPAAACGPPESNKDEERDEMAAEVLGIAFLAERPGAKENLEPSSSSGRQWRKLLEQAKKPMRPGDRLGLRIQELWVIPDRSAQDADLDLEDWEKQELCTIQGTCLSNSAKDFFATPRNFTVQLPLGADVEALRAVLGTALPPNAKVLAEKGRKGLVTLKNSDPVPSEITVSDFKGSRNFYLPWTRFHSLKGLKMMRSFFRRPENQRALDQLQAETNGEDGRQYRVALAGFLPASVYPSILHRFNMPDDEHGRKAFMDGMSLVPGDPECAEVWLELETLMRNEVNIAAAFNAVRGHRFMAGVSRAELPGVVEEAAAGPAAVEPVEANPSVDKPSDKLEEPAGPAAVEKPSEAVQPPQSAPDPDTANPVAETEAPADALKQPQATPATQGPAQSQQQRGLPRASDGEAGDSKKAKATRVTQPEADPQVLVVARPASSEPGATEVEGASGECESPKRSDRAASSSSWFDFDMLPDDLTDARTAAKKPAAAPQSHCTEAADPKPETEQEHRGRRLDEPSLPPPSVDSQAGVEEDAQDDSSRSARVVTEFDGLEMVLPVREAVEVLLRRKPWLNISNATCALFSQHDPERPLVYGRLFGQHRAPVALLTAMSEEMAEYLRSDPQGPFADLSVSPALAPVPPKSSWGSWGFQEDKKERILKADWHTVPQLGSRNRLFVPRFAEVRSTTRAPPRIAAFIMALRVVNQSSWAAIMDALTGLRKARERDSANYREEGRGKLLGTFKECFLNQRHLGAVEAQVRFGPEKLFQPSHKDGATSLLHLGITLGGRRSLRCGLFPDGLSPGNRDRNVDSDSGTARGAAEDPSECGVWDEAVWKPQHLMQTEMVPGSLYLSSPFCFEHAVMYEACTAHDPMIALMCRFAFPDDLGPLVNEMRNEDMLDIVTVVSSCLEAAGQKGQLRLPSLDEVRQQESRLEAMDAEEKRRIEKIREDLAERRQRNRFTFVG